MSPDYTFPDYTQKERRFDGAIHWIGVGAACVAAPALLLSVAPAGDVRAVAAAAIYGAALVAMLGTSAAYNLAVHPARKERLRRYDHAAIFLMIAGTYTPFALIGVGGRAGLGLLAVVWLVAAFGMWLKLFRPRRFERGSVLVYLALGWAGLAELDALVAALSRTTLALLGAGGVLYTVGVAFHLCRRLPYHNAVWHALVLAAAGCHYVAVLYVIAEG